MPEFYIANEKCIGIRFCSHEKCRRNVEIGYTQSKFVFSVLIFGSQSGICFGFSEYDFSNALSSGFYVSTQYR